jgi:hypothetical protein
MRLFSLDVQSMLPTGFLGEVVRAATDYGKQAILQGGAPSSLEESSVVLHYTLLDGVAVAEKLSWLDDLYCGALLKFASESFGVELVRSPSMRNGVNVNILKHAGARYERSYLHTRPKTAENSYLSRRKRSR